MDHISSDLCLKSYKYNTDMCSLLNYFTYTLLSSAGQPHEGSSYAAQKDLQMAFHRLEHVRSRLAELERMKADYRLQTQKVGMQRSMSQTDPSIHGMQRTFTAPDGQVPPPGAQRSMSYPEGPR